MFFLLVGLFIALNLYYDFYMPLDSIAQTDELFNQIPNQIDRAMFILFYYWGLTYQEIAYCFAVNESLVTTRITKTKAMIELKYE